MKKVIFEKKQRSKPKKAKNVRALVVRPPMLTDQLAQQLTLRFITTSNFTGSVGVSYTNLLDSWLIATGSTTAFQLFDFIKIRRVTVRAIAGTPQSSAAGSVANVAISFPGISELGSGRQVEETMLGATTPAVVSLTPGKDTIAGKWQASNNAIAFVIRGKDYSGAALKGMVIDVDCVWKNSGEVTPVAITSAVTAATAGQIYFGGIDGARLAATAAYSAFNPII